MFYAAQAQDTINSMVTKARKLRSGVERQGQQVQLVALQADTLFATALLFGGSMPEHVGGLFVPVSKTIRTQFKTTRKLPISQPRALHSNGYKIFQGVGVFSPGPIWQARSASHIRIGGTAWGFRLQGPDHRESQYLHTSPTPTPSSLKYGPDMSCASVLTIVAP